VKRNHFYDDWRTPARPTLSDVARAFLIGAGLVMLIYAIALLVAVTK